MESQEKNLASLFQQLRNKSEKSETPDIRLKDAVFSTIDAAGLVADIVDLFTFKFIQAHSEVLDAVPAQDMRTNTAPEIHNDKEQFFNFLEKKRKERKAED
jgi:hypothetical protein